MLRDMPNAFINSAREKRHLRAPVWREKSKVLHFRDHDLNDIVAALGQRSAEPLKLKKTYLGTKRSLRTTNCKLPDKHYRQPKKEREAGQPINLQHCKSKL